MARSQTAGGAECGRVRNPELDRGHGKWCGSAARWTPRRSGARPPGC
uniref:Uncharacterized protein n=1 Tax=Arundo donax TaxID=35708 RepID=A0A0A8Y4M0_ARUDO